MTSKHTEASNKNIVSEMGGTLVLLFYGFHVAAKSHFQEFAIFHWQIHA